ncbi:acyl-CoA dehydratase activase-related protein [Culicoidibacter larvae]|uniref:CoA activase n=1 Tax=Culicoidibacter larvae TaxID=2579976 RepID=A0A5R8QEM0_9FIRM|nr:acyl-CoA dehydratase activase-related protein [Culicoidibacter larvae]TLG74237.1 CoA activase [Culicoidibacter larvae]
MSKKTQYKLGIDIGSTTAKAVLTDEYNNIVYSKYVRHNAKINETLITILKEIKSQVEGQSISMAITGTAGMGVAEKIGLFFVQEVVASAEVVKALYPEVKTLIDLGGEDAKIIFFNDLLRPDIRMNGNCAGGTGAFIDQMASLLNIEPGELNELAKKSQTYYSIASRCGVFAKTDVQTLLSRDTPREDIAASIFQAVALQTINSLARGTDINPKIMFVGGPLTFLPMLRQAFIEQMKVSDEDILMPESPELFPALGTAIVNDEGRTIATIDEVLERLENTDGHVALWEGMDPLFNDDAEYQEWKAEKAKAHVEVLPIKNADNAPTFLGIDSGSTTTKIVLINENGDLVFNYYTNNNGNPVQAVLNGLEELNAQATAEGVTLNIARGAVTGYGEDLIKTAFKLDDGLVETIAHYRAAKRFNPEVSFILDIGGQDMKAIFIKDGVITNLEINEACSSGAGSFIETFAKSLGHNVQDFANYGVQSRRPCDLGTRCTVFMNSKVKQSFREGAQIEDISAGLAYSVMRNCFFKLLKVSDPKTLGENIVVQGGTFKNDAVLRAMEVLVGGSVVRPNIAELMGAYGSALIAQEMYNRNQAYQTTFVGLTDMQTATQYTRRSLTCNACDNLCSVQQLKFDGNEVFYTGNKCEKVFSNQGTAKVKGDNLPDYKYHLLFDRESNLENPKLSIGIPRTLNMYESYPYWHTLFTECGINVVLSDTSTMALAQKGAGTVMSENICFPAKIAHGHIANLATKEVDRIFYPMVRYESTEYEDALNSYNCPVVTGYPDVIKSAMNPKKRYGIPFDNPVMTFSSNDLLSKSSWEYVKKLGIDEAVFNRAFDKAIQAQNDFKQELNRKAEEIIKKADAEGRMIIMIVGRPYHVDPLINHKIPDMIAALGVSVITEDSIDIKSNDNLDEVDVLTQWSYPNRIYNSALWAAKRKNVEMVQLNSFGCGPDAITIDEVRSIANDYGKIHTLVRIDEISSPGAIKLRLRSLIESVEMRGDDFVPELRERQKNKVFEKADRHRKILAPTFSPFYTDAIIAGVASAGFDIEILPMPDRASVDVGLKYTNNDICYPAVIVIGDLIKALQSGKYDTRDVAVAITQTGGQCRASSYVSLLKRGLINAGYADVPVVAISTGSTSGAKGLNEQPGLKYSSTNMMIAGLLGILFSDSMSKLYHYTAVRELNKGDAMRTVQKYVKESAKYLTISKQGKLFKLLEEAVEEFKAIPIDTSKDYPRVGIVGEIYAKYNPFGNGFVVDWLMDQGIEVDVPPILDFFLKRFINDEFNAGNNVQDKGKLYLAGMKAIEKVVEKYIDRTNNILKGFHVYRPFHYIRHASDKAERVLSLINQFGESWLLPAEIALFADEGVNDIVCIQPFGCIANHVIAKGAEKRIKDLYPDVNILYIDMDPGISEVNIANRLRFLVNGAHETLARQQEAEAAQVL